jgi:hypothetical protein
MAAKACCAAAKPVTCGEINDSRAIPFRDFPETKISSEGECLQGKGSLHV